MKPYKDREGRLKLVRNAQATSVINRGVPIKLARCGGEYEHRNGRLIRDGAEIKREAER